jgi:hypothetical protein
MVLTKGLAGTGARGAMDRRQTGAESLGAAPRMIGGEGTRTPSSRKNGLILVSILSVLSGALLLLENSGVASLKGVHSFWPVFPLLLGTGFLILFKQRRSFDLVLFFIGVYLVGVSVLFFFCSFYGWQVMAKAWPFFVGLAGLAAVCTARFIGTARRFLLLSGTFFMFLSLVFFLVFNINAALWPSALVILGVWLFILVNL